MKAKASSDTVWFNVMPVIGGDQRAMPHINLEVEPDQVLPEGEYAIIVSITGPDGVVREATTSVKVKHAH